MTEAKQKELAEKARRSQEEIVAPPPAPPKVQIVNPPKPRKGWAAISATWTKAASFAKRMKSRGLTNERVDFQTRTSG